MIEKTYGKHVAKHVAKIQLTISLLGSGIQASNPEDLPMKYRDVTNELCVYIYIIIIIITIIIIIYINILYIY